jgi:hypothetical protein
MGQHHNVGMSCENEDTDRSSSESVTDALLDKHGSSNHSNAGRKSFLHSFSFFAFGHVSIVLLLGVLWYFTMSALHRPHPYGVSLIHSLLPMTFSQLGKISNC